jgi:hypothetical protein
LCATVASLKCGRDLRWANGWKLVKAPASLCRLFPAHIFDLERSAAGAVGTLSRSLLRSLVGAFPWPHPISMLELELELAAAPRTPFYSAVSTSEYLDDTPSRLQITAAKVYLRLKSLAGWMLTYPLPSVHARCRHHKTRAIIRNKGLLNHGLTLLSEASRR